MRKHLLLAGLVFACVVGAYAEGPIPEATAERLLQRDFFVFDNGVGRGKWTPEQQAETLARLGYSGIGYSGTEELAARLAAFSKHGVKVFNIYVPCHVDAEVAYGEDLKDAIGALKGSGVTIWLTVQGKADNDEKAVRIVSEIADLAGASGLQVALYPHAGFFVADIEDALRIVNQSKRSNLGVTFNLCHELKAGNEARFDALLKEAMPHLFLVSINGADHEGGWDTLIQPLGRGAFDVAGLLRKILTLGYGGPIGLQCYAVQGDTLENLEHSIATWKELIGKLAKKEG